MEDMESAIKYEGEFQATITPEELKDMVRVSEGGNLLVRVLNTSLASHVSIKKQGSELDYEDITDASNW